MSARNGLIARVAALGCVLLLVAVLLWRRDYLAVAFSPSTQTGGPVSISTDHRDYVSAETVRFAIENHLPYAIYVLADANCSSFTFQGQYDGSWGQGYYNFWDGCAQPVPDTPGCVGIGTEPRVPLTSTPVPVIRWNIIRLASGASYHQSLYPPHVTTVDPTPVPTGLYRLAVFYATESVEPTLNLPDVSSDDTLPAPFAVAYSATLHFQQETSVIPEYKQLCA